MPRKGFFNKMRKIIAAVADKDTFFGPGSCVGPIVINGFATPVGLAGGG